MPVRLGPFYVAHPMRPIRTPMKLRGFILTLLAMIAFASNSLLCRGALRDTSIDAASFTLVRIFAGAIALYLIVIARSRFSFLITRHSSLSSGNWISAFALFGYAAAFSFAYVDLSAGTGALLLFGAVQATMILWGLRKRERLDAIQIVGLAAALIGLVLLVLPGISAPPFTSSVLMLGAGVAWGIYSLRGKNAADAIAATTGNFLRAVPFAALVSLIMLSKVHLDSMGIVYAVISGAITSGIGYVIWYTALPNLRAVSAATVQLSVPVLAATGGILFFNEPISWRYFIASVAVLGGILLVIIDKKTTASG
jgi:drug/metabolite transporter (DMT)-like permease